ncbi:MAG: HAD family hydrolase [Clostridiales bacterium]|nr:HAD family hydrolase [Clostridiales bacterium]
MKKPKLVIFDFGGTLIQSTVFWLDKGMEALRLAAINPKVTTTEAMCELWDHYYNRLEAGLVCDDLEVRLTTVFRNIFAQTGLKYDIPLWQCEAVFDRYNSDRQPTEHMVDLLKALKDSGIRTGVISNTVVSGNSMAQAVKEQFPKSRMKFVITSADYLFKKPHSDMFKAAAKIAEVEPQDCWYCGDSFEADVKGAHSVGMFAVHYDPKSHEAFSFKDDEGKQYLQINSWAELIKNLPE